MLPTQRQVITASVCEAHSYLNVYSWSPSSAEQLPNLPRVPFSTARKQLTHTCTQTEGNNHEMFLYVLFSPFGNPRVNIFINHITGHDAPKFTLSVYRNTLNRTQGFTMDTQLTFCPLHLQQWMTVSRFFVLFFFFPAAPVSSHHLADDIHQLLNLWIVWRWHSTF